MTSPIEQAHAQADAALRRGDAAGARTALESVIRDAVPDFALWLKLAGLRRQAGDAAGALDAVNRALDVQPNTFLALLLKASLLEQTGSVLATELYQAALFHAPAEQELSAPLKAQVGRARRYLAEHRERVEKRLTAASALSDEHAGRRARFLDNVIARRPVYRQEPTHYRYPGLPDIEFFDDAYTDLRARLRAAFSAIRKEFSNLVATRGERQTPYVDFAPGEPVGPWAALNRSSDWNALHLVRYGEVDHDLADRCPETMRAFAGPDQLDVAGLAPNLMFSILAPRAHIPPHHGVANFRVVAHLPLVVPDGCRFRVGADTRPWVEGEPWIFDDCIEHEAWNDSDEVRVVLIGDLWRPELETEDRAIVRDVMAAMGGPAGIGAL